ncbi:MAG: adenylate/guanylate cyclase domain-containing protein [Spirochaetales bacterium]|nr:adenylate/guanylate cyclase domain-containing protein [Spirochaetales bacterium]
MPDTRLAAIAFVDLDGFADLVGSNEKDALSRLHRFRELADPLVGEYGGELVDATNDELMVLFDSALSALQFALHLRLAARAGSGQLRVRAGIHLGEIWRDGARVYGNGVNVAARVKQEARGGDILVSEDIWRQVSNKLELRASEIKGADLKNIERDLVIWRVEAEEYAASEEPAPGSTAASSGTGNQSDEAPDSAEGAVQSGKRVRDALEAALLRGAEARRRDESALERLADLGTLDKLGIHAELVSNEDGSARVTLRTKTETGTDRRERLHAFREKAVSRMVRGALVGLAFGFFAWQANSLWLWGTAILAGMLPAISGVRQLVEANGKLKTLDREGRARSET